MKKGTIDSNISIENMSKTYPNFGDLLTHLYTITNPADIYTLKSTLEDLEDLQNKLAIYIKRIKKEIKRQKK